MTMSIVGMTEKQVRDHLDTDHWSSKLLARVICSAYWGAGFGVDLRMLDQLDEENWRIAVAVMGYRRTLGWSDDDFYSLAFWCRVRHGLGE